MGASRFLVLALVIAGWGATPARAASEQPLGDCSGLPCVTLAAGGAAPLTMLIDTGNGASVLDLGKAKALGLALTPYTSRSGKTIPGYFTATLKDVRFGDERLGDITFLAASLSKSIADGSLPKADGTLDYVDLKDRALTLDFARHVISIAPAPANSACAVACGAMSHPTFGRKGPPIVATTGFKVNGQDVTVQVDTLYSGTMLIYPTSVTKLGLDAQAKASRQRMFPFTDGGVPMIEGRAKTEAFGETVLARDAPLYFATPTVHTPDGLFDGTVGMGLFAGHIVHMDFKSQTFWME